ncbi:response regulator [Chryseobacterium caseinilyticum]|uniref:Response regulator n=1 Tax=Chryseobacterium caseinilyticum TaxID=2771428 RepID=A0ABR8ZGX4_9FLAO|nr:response regulator [Chryseobacterium caseinilyticum]MBD8084549.1 response regulator [Chryseobacterium caseinilyticum]
MGKKILIFDDDIAILELLQVILTDLEFEVEVSQFSENVLTLVKDFQPDLILMDNLLPPVSGAEAVQIIRSSGLFNHLPIIMITACPNTAALSKRAGANDFLMKPFDINELENLVKLHLFG